jgi:hypothetical protein
MGRVDVPDIPIAGTSSRTFFDGRDVFLTDDLGLSTMCDRLRKEHGFAIHAESLKDYVARC